MNYLPLREGQRGTTQRDAAFQALCFMKQTSSLPLCCSHVQTLIMLVFPTRTI